MMNKQTYTVSKLQTYYECHRKYKFMYVDNLKFVEISSKLGAMQGNNIHAIINYHLKGFDVTKLVDSLTPDELVLWDNYLCSAVNRYNYISSEYSFAVKFDKYWLTGRIDALFEYNGDYFIFDWKTGKNFQASNVMFQTEFYLLCMFEILRLKNLLNSPTRLALKYINLVTKDVEQIKFDENLYAQYQDKILSTITNINNDSIFAPEISRSCQFCKYNSLCLAK